MQPTKAVPDVWDVQYILASPSIMPRYHALGSDALAIVQAHVSSAAELAASSTSPPEACAACLSEVGAALAWLPRARDAGLLQDCDPAEIAEAEEVWLTLETELEERVATVRTGGRG